MPPPRSPGGSASHKIRARCGASLGLAWRHAVRSGRMQSQRRPATGPDGATYGGSDSGTGSSRAHTAAAHAYRSSAVCPHRGLPCRLRFRLSRLPPQRSFLTLLRLEAPRQRGSPKMGRRLGASSGTSSAEAWRLPSSPTRRERTAPGTSNFVSVERSLSARPANRLGRSIPRTPKLCVTTWRGRGRPSRCIGATCSREPSREPPFAQDSPSERSRQAPLSRLLSAERL